MYELLCKEFGRDTGVFFELLSEAVAEAGEGDEVWCVADDIPRTRVKLEWPQNIVEGVV